MDDNAKSKTRLIAELVALRRQVVNLEKEKTSAIQVKDALQTDVTRFRTIVESAPLMIDAFDENGRCILWNNECERVFGWTMDELNSHVDPLSLFYPDPQVRDQALASLTSSPERNFQEWRPVTKDGEERVCLWANISLNDGTVMNLGQDITESKRAEEELLRSEYIVDSSADMMALLDKGFTYLAANPTYLDAMGTTKEDLIGRTVSAVLGEEFFQTKVKPHAERCLMGDKGQQPGLVPVPGPRASVHGYHLFSIH